MKRIFKKLVSYLSQFELYKPSQDVYDVYFETFASGGYYNYGTYSQTPIWEEADVFTTVFEPYIKNKWKVFNMEYRLKNESDREVVNELVSEIAKKLETKYKIEEIWIHEDDSGL